MAGTAATPGRRGLPVLRAPAAREVVAWPPRGDGSPRALTRPGHVREIDDDQPGPARSQRFMPRSLLMNRAMPPSMSASVKPARSVLVSWCVLMSSTVSPRVAARIEREDGAGMTGRRRSER